jgi:hypothetical protein
MTSQHLALSNHSIRGKLSAQGLLQKNNKQFCGGLCIMFYYQNNYASLIMSHGRNE